MKTVFRRAGLFAALLAAAVALPPLAAAQIKPIASVNVSGTIAVTNTFQSIIARNTNRSGCTVQNTGTNTMYVFFGPLASASTAASVKLAAGQAVSCNNGPVTLIDEVSITGTATEAFFAAHQ